MADIQNTTIDDLVPSEKALEVAVNLILPTKNELVNSGLAARGPAVDKVAGGGPRKASLAYLNPLDTSDVNVGNDDINDEGDVGKLTADEFIVLRHDLNYAWGTADLANMVTQYNAEGGIRAGIAQYWGTIFNKLAGSSLKGVKAALTANATITHSVATDFDMATIYDVTATAGLYADQFNVMIVNPARYAKLQGQESNGYIPASKTNTNLPNYQGFTILRSNSGVVGDDDVVLGRVGGLAFGSGVPAGITPIEKTRKALGGGGQGGNILSSRQSVVLHPQGMNYAGGIPTKATLFSNLEAAASWSLEVPAEQFGFRFITFNAS